MTGVGGKRFHKGAARTYVNIHRTKGSSKTNRACMIYFHGGGAIAGSPEQMTSPINRYAVESGVQIIAAKYRLGPEHKAPAGINDGYAVTKHVIENPKKFGCNPKRVGIFGDSGGGYITAGVGMRLAQNNEGDLVRFQIQMIPQVSNTFLRRPMPKGMNKMELMMAPNMKEFYSVLCVPKGKKIMDYKNNPECFPTEMSDELASKVPPVIVTTCEFDFFRAISHEGAELYRRNGKLLDFAEYGGVWHGHYINYDLKQTDRWFKDFSRMTEKYLN